MRPDDWQLLYRCLRDELDAAYAARPWDGRRIDRIAADLMCLERTRLVEMPHELPSALRGGAAPPPPALAEAVYASRAPRTH